MIPEKSGEFYLKVWYNYNDLRKYRERAREGWIWNAENPRKRRWCWQAAARGAAIR